MAGKRENKTNIDTKNTTTKKRKNMEKTSENFQIR
jgi:hypothetical protein